MEIYRLLRIYIQIDKFDRLMSLESQKDSQSLKTENKKPPTHGRWKKGLEIFIWEDKYSLWE